MVNLHGFQTALALPASDQYKSQLVIQTAESLNHIRMGRSDAQASLAKVLVRPVACSMWSTDLLHKELKLSCRCSCGAVAGLCCKH